MKNLIYSLAILIAIGLVGCGGAGSAGDSSVDNTQVTNDSSAAVDTSTEVTTGESQDVVDITTAQTPYNLSSNLGTPPSLPGS